MAPVLKTGDLQGSGGSNPSPSAKSAFFDIRKVLFSVLNNKGEIVDVIYNCCTCR